MIAREFHPKSFSTLIRHSYTSLFRYKCVNDDLPHFLFVVIPFSLSLHSARIPMEFRTQLLMSPFFYWTRKVTPQIKVVIENDNHFAHAEQSFSLRTYMDSCLVHRIPIKWSGDGSGCRGRDMFSLLLHWKFHVPCEWVREKECRNIPTTLRYSPRLRRHK